MFLILKLIYNEAVFHFKNAGSDDLRTADLPIIGSYTKLAVIAASYLLLVLKILPKFMKNREPYNLKIVMQFYNIFQILMNLYIYYGISKYFTFHPNYHWSCMGYDVTDWSPEIIKLRRFTYLYFINKLIDCLDTVFFVLRKKYDQVTFLHVYHHVIMIYGVFNYHIFAFGSQLTAVGHINALIHVLMYFYYFVAALDTNWNINAWKPRMTELQILQFVYIAVKLSVVIPNNWCGAPLFWIVVLLTQNLFMIVMFSNFYWKTYIVKARRLNPKEKEPVMKNNK